MMDLKQVGAGISVGTYQGQPRQFLETCHSAATDEVVESPAFSSTSDQMRDLAQALARELAADKSEVHLENVTPKSNLESWVRSGSAQGRFETLKIRVKPGSDEVDVMYGVQDHGRGVKSYFLYEGPKGTHTEQTAHAITWHNIVLITDPFSNGQRTN